jgi:patatin-like phospholipase/acyl hydrolase
MGANITTFIYSQRTITQTIKCRGFNKMIISDLQYIESADNSEVQGGSYDRNIAPNLDNRTPNLDNIAPNLDNRTPNLSVI